jgi:hypothetical protein
MFLIYCRKKKASQEVRHKIYTIFLLFLLFKACRNFLIPIFSIKKLSQKVNVFFSLKSDIERRKSEFRLFFFGICIVVVADVVVVAVAVVEMSDIEKTNILFFKNKG